MSDKNKYMCDICMIFTPCHELSHFLRPPSPLELDVHVFYGRPLETKDIWHKNCHEDDHLSAHEIFRNPNQERLYILKITMKLFKIRSCSVQISRTIIYFITDVLTQDSINQQIRSKSAGCFVSTSNKGVNPEG